jgi:hypothetical protein
MNEKNGVALAELLLRRLPIYSLATLPEQFPVGAFECIFVGWNTYNGFRKRLVSEGREVHARSTKDAMIAFRKENYHKIESMFT